MMSQKRLMTLVASLAIAAAPAIAAAAGPHNSTPAMTKYGPLAQMTEYPLHEVPDAMPGIVTSDLGMNYGAVAPPPGTLGQTYQRKSRPIPRKDHPRTGMLVVRGAGHVADMRVQGRESEMRGYRDERTSAWRFTTKDEPLLPGVPHIFHVEARNNEDEEDPFRVLTVRLIPGRIVYLDF